MWCDDALDLRCVCLAPHHAYQSNKFKDILRRIMRLDINLFNAGRILSTASRNRQCIQLSGAACAATAAATRDRLRLAFLFDYCFEAGHRPPTSRQRRLLLGAALVKKLDQPWWECCAFHMSAPAAMVSSLASKMWQNHFDYEFLRRPLSLFRAKKVTPRMTKCYPVPA